MLLVIAIVVLLGVAAAVITYPLLQGEGPEESPTESDRSALEDEKQAKYREIRDLEMDFRSGKLSEADYRRTDAQLRSEAIEILKRIDKL